MVGSKFDWQDLPFAEIWPMLNLSEWQFKYIMHWIWSSLMMGISSSFKLFCLVVLAMILHFTQTYVVTSHTMHVQGLSFEGSESDCSPTALRKSNAGEWSLALLSEPFSYSVLLQILRTSLLKYLLDGCRRVFLCSPAIFKWQPLLVFALQVCLCTAGVFVALRLCDHLNTDNTDMEKQCFQVLSGAVTSEVWVI